MDRQQQRFEIQWQGLVIEVLYCPSYSPSYHEIYGYALAHLEVSTIQPEKEPLPMTPTGYQSHFDRADNIDAAGGPVAFVQAWLDHEAQSPQWKKQAVEERQLSLF